MSRAAFALLAVMFLGGCVGIFSKRDDVKDASLPSDVTVQDVRGDRPEFRRVYTVRLSERATMKLTIRNFSGHVYHDGELTQPNGRWVTFEPERPADKILDRDLVPLVEKYCDAILKSDKAYRKNPPREYTDESGQTWRRVE